MDSKEPTEGTSGKSGKSAVLGSGPGGAGAGESGQEEGAGMEMEEAINAVVLRRLKPGQGIDTQQSPTSLFGMCVPCHSLYLFFHDPLAVSICKLCMCGFLLPFP